jgi:hypothetical protein
VLIQKATDELMHLAPTNNLTGVSTPGSVVKQLTWSNQLETHLVSPAAVATVTTEQEKAVGGDSPAVAQLDFNWSGSE